MRHYKRLGLHLWNCAIRQGRADHVLAMVSYYRSSGKGSVNRMQMAACRQELLSNWAHYAVAACQPALDADGGGLA